MTEKQLLKLSKIKNPKCRRLVAKMAFTWEVIQRMEKYHKENYGDRGWP